MLELRGGGAALLDDPIELDVGGAPPQTRLTFRTRIRDDDGRVWRGIGETLDDLRWAPAKPGPQRAALGSLRGVELEVRVEDTSGRASTRELTRTILAPDVKVRRWGTARAFLPSEKRGRGLSFTADADPVACALLASRGFVVVVGEAPPELLASVAPDAERLDTLPLPAGVPAIDADPGPWRALLQRLC